MKFGEAGGIIAAASKKDAVPLLQIGSIPIIKRIVLSLQQAGVFPIVIVTGTEETEVVHQIAPLGVLFVRNEECDAPELFSSVKLGLSFLKGKCDRVVFTPVNTPMFTPDTLKTLLAGDAPVVRPSFRGRSGHPIVLKDETIDGILHYAGGDGLRGALRMYAAQTQWCSVEDEGILMSIHDEAQLQQHLRKHNNAMLAPGVRVSIEKEGAFFGQRLKLLLFLIADIHSVRQACMHMGLSYANAWNMINRLEQEVGYAVVERKHGGRRGGQTILTEKGMRLIYAYQEFETRLKGYARLTFDTLFKEQGLL